MIDSILNIIAKLPKFYGWCSVAKSQRLIELVLTTKPSLCVEIGVFDGSSLFPVALALKEIGSGKIIGIDPWNLENSMEGMKGNHLDWWRTVDHNRVCTLANNHRVNLSVTNHCEFIRKSSANAIDHFSNGSIGMLHIDGNHTTDACMRDAVLYLPKVSKDGIIVCDDLSWMDNGIPSVRNMVNWLMDNGCSFLSLVGNCVILKRTR